MKQKVTDVKKLISKLKALLWLTGEMISCEFRVAILRKLIYELRVTFYEMQF